MLLFWFCGATGSVHSLPERTGCAPLFAGCDGDLRLSWLFP
jgi:hypothetical protein